MDEYKPKRFEYVNFLKGGSYGLGIQLATERYGVTRDYYVSIHFGIGAVHIVFLRVSTTAS